MIIEVIRIYIEDGLLSLYAEFRLKMAFGDLQKADGVPHKGPFDAWTRQTSRQLSPDQTALSIHSMKVRAGAMADRLGSLTRKYPPGLRAT